MTKDEEMAEEYVNNQGKDNILDFGENHIDVSFIKREAFLEGLNAGRPKWHKVADGDLPEEEAEYFVIFESDGTLYRGLESYYPDTKEWSTICKIIAWCEIPKFEEE